MVIYATPLRHASRRFAAAHASGMIMASYHPYLSMLVVLHIESGGVLDPNHLRDHVAPTYAGIQPDGMIHATD